MCGRQEAKNRAMRWATTGRGRRTKVVQRKVVGRLRGRKAERTKGAGDKQLILKMFFKTT